MSDQSNKVADDIMQNMLGVFNKKAEDVNFVDEQESEKIFFNPDSKKANGQVWRGIIKFMPNLHNPDSMTVTKIQHWMPEGNNGFMVDSPKSVEKWADCPMTNLFFELKNSDNAQNKEKAKKIKYYRKTFALIQILKDLQNPENVGKIMIWNLPVDVQKKIKAQMYPSAEDIDMGSVANNVFDPAHGFPMTLKIGIKNVDGDEYRDYSSCDFVKESATMLLTGEDKLVQLSDDPAKLMEQQKAMISTILDGPNLNDFAYKAPSPEQLQKLANAIAAFKGQPLTASQPKAAQPEAQKPTENAQPQVTTQEQKPAESPKTAVNDEADDILSQLNLNAE